VTRLALAAFAVAALVGCGGGVDKSADVASAVKDQYPRRAVTCETGDVEYGGEKAYSCKVGGKPRCFGYVDGELVELWNERPLRPGEPGYAEGIGATVRTGPSC